VRINGRPRDEEFEPLRKGMVIDGERFQPMQVTLDRQQGANAWLTIGLREGKNREIRRAIEDIGFNVNRLLRVSYGPFQLGDLKPGAVEEIRRKVMRDQLGLAAEPEPEKPAKSKRPMRKRPSMAGKPGRPKPPEDSGKPRGRGKGGGKGPGKPSDGRPSQRRDGRSGGKPIGKNPRR